MLFIIIIEIYIYIYIEREREREREFKPMTSTPDITLYHQIKILIGFLCRRRLNFSSLIQLSETLSVELIGTH